MVPFSNIWMIHTHAHYNLCVSFLVATLCAAELGCNEVTEIIYNFSIITVYNKAPVNYDFWLSYVVCVLDNTVLFLLLYVLGYNMLCANTSPVAVHYTFECSVVRTNSILMGTSPILERPVPVLWSLNAFLSATHHLSPHSVFTFVCCWVIRVAHCPKEACSHAVPSDHFLFQDPIHVSEI